jgi:hypothetical protein
MTAIIPLSPFGMPSSPVLPRLYRAADAAPACRLPLLLQRIPAGFPSPADELYQADGFELEFHAFASVYRHSEALCNDGVSEVFGQTATFS